MKWTVDPQTGDNWANIVTINKSSRSDQGQFWIQHDMNNNKLEFALELESGRQFMWATSQVQKDEWIHFAATYDGSVQRFYINGIEEAHKSRSGNIRSFESDFTLTIGKWAANNGNRYFEGEVDEISIWKRALTVDEIRDYMTEKLNESESQLVAYYQFDEISEGMLEDRANNYDGIVEGGEVVTSTAPVGDQSVYTYGGSNLSLLSSDHTVEVSDFTGNPAGVHIYKVNESPNTIQVSDPEIESIEDGQYWGVFVIGSDNSTFKYTKKLLPGTDVSVNDSLMVAYRSNALNIWNWQNLTQDISDSTVFFYSDGSFNHREFILGKSNPSILPIELSEFNAIVKDNVVEIAWTTASEINNDYFTIQRSADGDVWEDAGIVYGAGNSNISNTYTFTDEMPFDGVSYYRLKQTDFDGSSETFKMKSVYMSSIEANNDINITIFPNPVVNDVFVEINDYTTEIISLEIVDMGGKVLKSENKNSIGKTEISFRDIPQGVYFLKVKTYYGDTFMKKVIKK